MRLRLILAASSLALLVGAGAPPLQLFSTFSGGQYKMTPVDDDSKMRQPGGAAQCMTSPDLIVHAGHDAASAAACEHTIIENTADRAIVTYVCKGQGYGRTDIRRDANGVFVVEAQGIAGKDPYDMRGEFKRVGDCKR